MDELDVIELEPENEVIEIQPNKVKQKKTRSEPIHQDTLIGLAIWASHNNNVRVVSTESKVLIAPVIIPSTIQTVDIDTVIRRARMDNGYLWRDKYDRPSQSRRHNTNSRHRQNN